LGELFDWVMAYQHANGVEIKLINTVHDSVLLDISTDNEVILKSIGIEIKRLLENVPAVMKDLFGMNIDMPLTVDVEVGKTWGSKKKLEV